MTIRPASAEMQLVRLSTAMMNIALTKKTLGNAQGTFGAGVYLNATQETFKVCVYVRVYTMYTHTYMFLYVYIVYTCRGAPSAVVDSDSEHCISENDTWQRPRYVGGWCVCKSNQGVLQSQTSHL